MTLSKYENNVFPYSLHSTVNLPAWRPKDICYFNLFSPSIHWDSYSRKNVFFFKITWQMLSKLTKSVRNCEHPILWRNHQNWNLSFHKFLLKHEALIKNKELHDKEQTLYTNFFYSYVLKNFHLKFFHIFSTKGNS